MLMDVVIISWEGHQILICNGHVSNQEIGMSTKSLSPTTTHKKKKKWLKMSKNVTLKHYWRWPKEEIITYEHTSHLSNIKTYKQYEAQSSKGHRS